MVRTLTVTGTLVVAASLTAGCHGRHEELRLFVEMGGGGSDRGRVARSLLARTLARSPPPRDRSLRVPKAATVPRPVVWEENRGGEAGVG